VSFVALYDNSLSKVLDIPLKELVQSADKVLALNCTVGVSRAFQNLSQCSSGYFQAITARRYTSDGTGEIRFIEDSERNSEYELDRIEKLISKLEQLMKVGTKADIEQYLNGIYKESSPENADLIVVQIIATVYRILNSVSEKSELAKLVSKNPIFARVTSYCTDETVRNELVNFCTSAKDIISSSQKRVSEVVCDKVIEIIDKEYGDEQLSLTSVSTRLAVSPNYLSALIKKTKGKNFVNLVTERRMKAAYDMLVCTTMKILEIAEKCGYTDQHYFSYCFKKFYGESPNKVRAANRGAV
jgi:two-component system response regulator YesN